MLKSSIYQGIEFSSHHGKIHFMTTQKFLITGILKIHLVFCGEYSLFLEFMK